MATSRRSTASHESVATGRPRTSDSVPLRPTTSRPAPQLLPPLLAFAYEPPLPLLAWVSPPQPQNPRAPAALAAGGTIAGAWRRISPLGPLLVALRRLPASGAAVVVDGAVIIAADARWLGWAREDEGRWPIQPPGADGRQVASAATPQRPPPPPRAGCVAPAAARLRVLRNIRPIQLNGSVEKCPHTSNNTMTMTRRAARALAGPLLLRGAQSLRATLSDFSELVVGEEHWALCAGDAAARDRSQVCVCVNGCGVRSNQTVVRWRSKQDGALLLVGGGAWELLLPSKHGALPAESTGKRSCVLF